MTLVRFHSTELHAEVENDVIGVGFFDGDERYLMLERGLVPDEQDISLGQDDVYIELNDQRYSSYGGISRFVIGHGFVEVQLEGKAARHLETESIHITFSESDPVLPTMRLRLKQLFERDPSVLVSTP